MANNLVTVNLQADTNLAEDVVVNAWSFTTAAAKDIGQASDIVTELDAFYTALSSFRSNQLTGDAIVKFYDRADVSPRVPWHQESMAVGTSDSSLPLEVALVLSMKAINVSGSPPARRRGRLFIGPLSQGALSNTTGRPTAGVLQAMALAAEGMRSASNATADWSWAIWSSVDNAAREVFEGWIDNDFDTQRRRGQVATARTLWGGP